CMQTLEFPFTF
nr:immunoglobulin light chain junction region [Macaca mulatta]MOW42131.1 immunoglobulin light chain junction region [Macaca mulatta]MOX07722.1 immunoglobulin light chain junction region [Macaca mulatta]MOX07800.1 immunoglobulin light chain junction region [Macaca mulatta]MOX08685.1 immunoglobulin light chain junction region [Macaca mulatta]